MASAIMSGLRQAWQARTAWRSQRAALRDRALGDAGIHGRHPGIGVDQLRSASRKCWMKRRAAFGCGAFFSTAESDLGVGRPLLGYHGLDRQTLEVRLKGEELRNVDGIFACATRRASFRMSRLNTGFCSASFSLKSGLIRCCRMANRVLPLPSGRMSQTGFCLSTSDRADRPSWSAPHVLDHSRVDQNAHRLDECRHAVFAGMERRPQMRRIGDLQAASGRNPPSEPAPRSWSRR